MKPNHQIVISHSGKQHSYHVAKSLNDLGFLKQFYTSSYIKSRKIQNYFLKHNNQFWTRRFLSGLSGNKVTSNWRFEAPEYIGKLLKSNSKKIEELVYARDIEFDNYVSNQILKIKPEVFWGFQGSCLNSLKSTKKTGGLAVCELATAHVTFAKKILNEEKRFLPDWADSISNVDFPAHYEKRLIEEPTVADIVIAASNFTKLSLTESGVPENKIHVLPLGADVEYIKYVEKKRDKNKPLKLLYAGTVTQRKGIYYLLEAMKSFNKSQVELHIIGNVFGPGTAFGHYKNVYTYHGSVSQQKLFETYHEFDALVLPTIFEGFALVIVEAMAAGLPVITTPHSIGPELINDNQNGYIVPIRNTEAIKVSIERILNKTEKEFNEMSILARSAALNYSWVQYKNRLGVFLRNMTLQ